MRLQRLHARLRAGSIASALSLCICTPATAQQTTAAAKSTVPIAEQSIGADVAIPGEDSALNVSRTAPQYPDKQIDPTLEDRQGNPQ